ncbi:MAG: hypothetical protein JST93_21770 [Acidobacteria bacterium]|nr:hypothetical protein [Acidobacteriota bacterium]
MFNRAFSSASLCVLGFLPFAVSGWGQNGSQAQVEMARKQIMAAYQDALEALRRGDADGAMQMDTEDWISITVGQKARTRQEMEPFIRRDIASMKPPPEWSATWTENYQRDGTTSGIQIYDIKLNGTDAVVLGLVGNTRALEIEGVPHRVWTGSHIRDTWIRTGKGWKRRIHEKLTVNERMVDGLPAAH